MVAAVTKSIVDTCKAKLVGFEVPKKIGLVAELWTPDNDLLTATMKLKRQPIIKKHQAAFDAITAALGEGKGLADCLRAAEEAEAAQSESDKVAAVAQADALAKETPQERAAREREEMAARGRF